MLHSQLDTSLAFKCIFFLFFLSAGINTIGPEETDVAGDIVTGKWGHNNYQRSWYANAVKFCGPELDIIFG